MKYISGKIFILFWFLSLLTNGILGSVLPTGLKEYEFVYDRLERQDILTIAYFNYQLGPYSVDKNIIAIAPFDYLQDIPSEKVRLFSFLREDVRATRDLRTHGYETFRAGLAGQPLNNLFIYGHFVLDEEKAEDENYTGKEWRGFAGDVEEAFVHFRTGPIELTAGRYGSYWGLRNSLVLSGEDKLDGFGYTFQWGRLAVSYRLAQLDGLKPEMDNVTSYENRYLAAHRFDFHFSGHLRVGLFETVVFGGPGRQVDLFYLNPLIFFHGCQLNEHTNDNTMVGLDFTFKPKAGYKFYGQLLVDDIQLDDEEQSDQEPDELGFVLGSQTAGVLLPVDIELEYTRIANRTYNQILPHNRYLIHHDLIGAARGNDYDLARLSVSHWWGQNLRAETELSYYRQGEGRVETAWTQPWLEIQGDYHEKFPTGTVEKTFRFSVGFKGFIKKMFFIDVTAGIDRVNNYEHISGDDRTLPFFNLILSAFVSTGLNLR